MISIILHFWDCKIYGPGYVPSAFEKNVYSCIVGWSFLQIPVWSCWWMVVLSSPIFLLISCRFPINYWEASIEVFSLTVALSFSPFSSISFASHIFQPGLVHTHLGLLCFIDGFATSDSVIIFTLINKQFRKLTWRRKTYYINLWFCSSLVHHFLSA